jgi:hypothetical protein
MHHVTHLAQPSRHKMASQEPRLCKIAKLEQSHISICVYDSQKLLLILSQITKKITKPITNRHKSQIKLMACKMSSLENQAITNGHKHKHCKSCIIMNVIYPTIHKVCRNLIKTPYQLKYKSLWSAWRGKKHKSLWNGAVVFF